MTVIGRHQRTRAIAGILLVMVGVFVFAPDHVEASCGHYVKLGNRSARLGMSSGAERLKSSLETPSVPGRCQGPTCSKEPVSPAGPQSIPLRVSAEEWASLVQSGTGGSLNFEVLSRGLDVRAIRAPASRIFRPPRRPII